MGYKMENWQKVENRLTILETESRMSWKAHDEKSEIIWHRIEGSIRALFSKVEAIGKQKDVCMAEAKGHTYKTVAIVVGAPVTLFIILKVAEYFFK